MRRFGGRGGGGDAPLERRKARRYSPLSSRGRRHQQWRGCGDCGGGRCLSGLADLGFIEITRPLITAQGDDVDLQIAVFDQEMHADIKELGGSSRSDLLDIANIPIANSAMLPPRPNSISSPPAPAERFALTGVPKLAAELSMSLGGESARSLEKLVSAHGKACFDGCAYTPVRERVW